MFEEILGLISELRAQQPPARAVKRSMLMRSNQPIAEVRPNAVKWLDQTLELWTPGMPGVGPPRVWASNQFKKYLPFM
jgi:hypothetical protein